MSNESLEDIDYALSEVMELLQYNIPSIRDNAIFNGDGTGANLLGITATNVAKAFTTLLVLTQLLLLMSTTYFLQLFYRLC